MMLGDRFTFWDGTDGPIVVPKDVKPREKSDPLSEVYLLCCRDMSGGETEILCAYLDLFSAVEATRAEIFRGMNNGKGYYIESVELRQ